MKPKSGSLLFLLSILQCFFFVPKAFALSKIPSQPRHPFLISRKPIMSSSLTTPLVPSTAAAAAAASVRGGGDKEAEPEKSVEEIQEEALGNIRNCYRLAFLAGVVGTASVAWESYQRTSSVGWSQLTVVEQGDLIGHLFNFVFGAGLWQAFGIFRQVRGGVDRISPPNLLKLSQTLGWLWLGTTAIISLDGVVIAHDLLLSPKFVGVAAALLVANLPFGEWWNRRSLKEEAQPDVSPDYAKARRAGVGAARSMVWCVGSIAITAGIDLVECVTKTVRASGLEDRAGLVIEGLLDASESFIIGGFLASLCKTLLRAVLVSTKRNFSEKDPAFKEYFQAQTKLYGRIGSFFGYQALFTVLGYVAQAGEKLWFRYMG